MPIYEFVCTACNYTFDEIIPASKRDDDRQCPECGKSARRKMSLCAAPRKKNSDGHSHSSGKSCGSCTSHNCGSCS